MTKKETTRPVKLKVLTNERYKDLKKIFSNLSPIIEITRIKDSNELNYLSSEQKLDIDVIVFDITNNKTDQLQSISKLKNLNPEVKTILLTSEENRKYRSYYLYKGVDFFIFKEGEKTLFESIIKQLHLRKTRCSN